jgi:cold shock protein
MATGSVKWFNDAKGFGFISPDGGGADIFIHFSALMMDGYKTVKQGSRVTFEMVEGPKGLHAQNIQPESSLARSPDQLDSAMRRPASGMHDHAQYAAANTARQHGTDHSTNHSATQN